MVSTVIERGPPAAAKPGRQLIEQRAGGATAGGWTLDPDCANILIRGRRGRGNGLRWEVDNDAAAVIPDPGQPPMRDLRAPATVPGRP